MDLLTHVGLDAKATAASAEIGACNIHLGAGVSSEIGIKNDSLAVKGLGCGVKVGRQVGVSVFDNEVSVDFGKCSVM